MGIGLEDELGNLAILERVIVLWSLAKVDKSVFQDLILVDIQALCQVCILNLKTT